MLRLVCFLLLIVRAQGSTSCEVPSVYEGEATTVTCNFGLDLSTEGGSFSVDYYPPVQHEGEVQRRIILECNWPKNDEKQCPRPVDSLYTFDDKVSNSLTLQIPSASEKYIGRYVCQLVGKESSPQACTFTLKAPGPAPTASPTAAPKGTISSLTTPAAGATDKQGSNGTDNTNGKADEAGAQTGMIIGIVVGVGGAIIVAIIVAFILIRRRRYQAQSETSGKDPEAQLLTDAERTSPAKEYKDEEEDKVAEDKEEKEPEDKGEDKGENEDEDKEGKDADTDTNEVKDPEDTNEVKDPEDTNEVKDPEDTNETPKIESDTEESKDTPKT